MPFASGVPRAPPPPLCSGIAGLLGVKAPRLCRSPRFSPKLGPGPVLLPSCLGGRTLASRKGGPLGLQGRVGLTGSLNHPAGWGSGGPDLWGRPW